MHNAVLPGQARESRVLAGFHCSQTPEQVISLLSAFKEEPRSENTCGRVGLALGGDWLETACSLKAGKKKKKIIILGQQPQRGVETL